MILPLAVLGGAVVAIYTGEEVLKGMIKETPQHKKNKKVALKVAAVASAVVWVPVLGTIGATVSLLGLTGYYLAFPAFLVHDHVSRHGLGVSLSKAVHVMKRKKRGSVDGMSDMLNG